MLCLSRKDNEAVIIRKGGVEICRVRVLLMERNRVRMGFEGDDSIEFVREEIAGTVKDHPKPKQRTGA